MSVVAFGANLGFFFGPGVPLGAQGGRRAAGRTPQGRRSSGHVLDGPRAGRAVALGGTEPWSGGGGLALVLARCRRGDALEGLHFGARA